MQDGSSERARCALEGLSIGDALGHSLQWCAERIPRRSEPPAPWSWSDDTEMAASILATLEAHGTIEQDDLARRFARDFDAGRMYGPAMLHDYFPRVRAGEPWREVARSLFGGAGSLGNGGAMRVAPLGAWFADQPERLVEEARRSAEVTHCHPEGIAGAIAVASAAGWACRLRGSSPPDDLLGRVLLDVPDGEVARGLREARRLDRRASRDEAIAALGNGARVTAADTVPFALWAAAQHLGDFTEALWFTIGAYGDLDTNAAIVGGVVASFVGEAGIPPRWRRLREPLPGR